MEDSKKDIDDLINITPSLIEIFEDIIDVTIAPVTKVLEYSGKEILAFKTGITALICTLKRQTYFEDEKLLLAYEQGIQNGLEMLKDLNQK